MRPVVVDDIWKLIDESYLLALANHTLFCSPRLDTDAGMSGPRRLVGVELSVSFASSNSRIFFFGRACVVTRRTNVLLALTVCPLILFR